MQHIVRPSQGSEGMMKGLRTALVFVFAFAFALAFVAFSGCLENSPEGAGRNGPGMEDMSIVDLKAQSVRSADDLNSYSLKSSVAENVKIGAVSVNLTPKHHGMSKRILQVSRNASERKESTETVAQLNLSGYQASSRSTTVKMYREGQGAEQSRTGHTEIYQAGNSTHIRQDNGSWINIIAPVSIEAFWSRDSSNPAKGLAEMVNRSQAEIVGIESLDGTDAFKLKIVSEGSEYSDLYYEAIVLANEMAGYPAVMPSINRTEFDETAVIDKTAWISKETNLPLKYQTRVGFKVTAYIIGVLDAETRLMKMLNQSVPLGEISVEFETSEVYYDFNRSIQVDLPEEAF